MDLEHLREFGVLAKELHFGHAAEKSYASRTAFSRHICDLESYFGVQLVERSHPVRLTPAGMILAKYLDEATPRYYALRAALRGAGGPNRLYPHNEKT